MFSFGEKKTRADASKSGRSLRPPPNHLWLPGTMALKDNKVKDIAALVLGTSNGAVNVF